MNAEHLAPRLQIVAKMVPSQSRIADIGSDHAYLAINLIENNIADFAIAGEVAKGPLSNTKKEIEKYHYEAKVKARLGDGLAVITDDDQIDVICIAGMGGQLIRRILNDGQDKLKNVHRLVLQPNVGEYELRTWLVNHGFKIVAEDIVAEDYHRYEIIVAEHGQQVLDEEQLTFGPNLMITANETYRLKWQKELSRLTKIKQTLEEHPHHGERKLAETNQAIEQIKEMFEHVGQ